MIITASDFDFAKYQAGDYGDHCIIHGDCRDVLPKIPDKAIDLVLTDPPYGVRKKEEWDDEQHFRENIIRMLKLTRCVSSRVIWFCADKMMAEIVATRPFDLFRVLVWNKPAGSQFAGASHNKIWYSNELILLFGDKEDFKSVGTAKRMTYSVYDDRTLPFSEFNHPTPKPIDLIQWLCENHSNDGHLILDPFLGSPARRWLPQRISDAGRLGLRLITSIASSLKIDLDKRCYHYEKPN